MKAMRSFFLNVPGRPSRLRLRKLVFDVHHYVGLIIGLFVLVVGVSGSAIVFEPEMTRALNANLTRVTRSASRVSLQSIIDTLQREQPGIRLLRIYLPVSHVGLHATSQDEAYQILTIPQANSSQANGARRIVYTYADPYTGRILGSRMRGNGLLGWLVDLHENLLTGANGRMVNGVVAILLLILSISGIIIWWPGRRLWTKRIVITKKYGWKGLNWHLHNTVGFWASLLLAIISFGGIYFAFPQATRDIVNRLTFSADQPRPPKTMAVPEMTSTGAPARTIDQLIDSAQGAIPGGQVTTIRFPTTPGAAAEDAIRLDVNLPYDLSEVGSSSVFLDPMNGKVLRIDRYDQMPLGTRIISACVGIHFGRFTDDKRLAIPIKILWVLVGLAPGVLFISGVIMWRNRVVSRKLKKSTRIKVRPASTDEEKIFQPAAYGHQEKDYVEP